MIPERITPERIARLMPGEVFVFGSNLAGRHGKGAALFARTRFGARQYTGEGFTGLQNCCYALPTKDELLRPLALPRIGAAVTKFLHAAAHAPERHFLVTEIGCGLSGFSPAQIAPLFADAIPMQNVSLPARFWVVLEGQ